MSSIYRRAINPKGELLPMRWAPCGALHLAGPGSDRGAIHHQDVGDMEQ